VAKPKGLGKTTRVKKPTRAKAPAKKRAAAPQPKPKKKAKAAKAAPKKKTAKAAPKKRAAAAKPKKPAPRKITREEIDRRLALARGAAAQKKASDTGLRAQLARALEVAQSEATRIGYPTLLRLRSPPPRNEGSWVSPWVIVAQFDFKPAITYAQLYAVLDVWDGSKVSKRINRQRISRCRVLYTDPNERTTRDEYTLAGSFPWGFMLAQAKGECDPEDVYSTHDHGRVGSLAARYANTEINSVLIWLSSEIGYNTMKGKNR